MCADPHRGREHVAVVGIGKREAVDERLVAGDDSSAVGTRSMRTVGALDETPVKNVAQPLRYHKLLD